MFFVHCDRLQHPAALTTSM